MIKNDPFNCYLIGEDSLLIQCAEILLEKKHTILGIISTYPEIKDWAESHSILCYLSLSEFENKVIEKSFDFLFSIVNPDRLSNKILNFPRKLTINYHDSFLPGYAGVHATSWAILNGELSHGVSWHVVESQLDTGDLLKRAVIPIAENETTFSLNLKCFEKAIELFATLIDQLAIEQYQSEKQNLAQRSYFGLHQKPDGDGFINWCETGEAIVRYCHALYFGDYPNRFATPKIFFKNQIFVISRIRLSKFKSIAPPGTVVKINQKNLQISTGTLDILISNFWNIYHKKYRALDFVKQYKIKKNDTFKIFSEKSKANLRKTGSDVGKDETFWLKELLNTEAVPELPTMPFASKVAPKSYIFDIVIQEKENFLKKVAFLIDQPISWSDIMLVIWLIYLYRINPILPEGYTIGWNSRANGSQQLCGFYFSKYVPLTIRLKAHTTVLKAFKEILWNVEQVKHKHTFKVDIFFRYPSLTFHEEQWKVNLIPIAIEVVPALNHFKPDKKVGITIAISEKEHTCAIFQNQKNSPHLWLENVGGHLNTLLSAIVQLTEQQFTRTMIDQLPILTDFEYQLLSEKWSHSLEIAAEKFSIPQLFEQQVIKTPNAVAIVFEDHSITYNELNNRANQLAYFLVKQGVKQGNIVTVCMESSIHFITSILSIAKIGAIYIPISTKTPDLRIKQIIFDSKTKYILTQSCKKMSFENIHLRIPVTYVDKKIFALKNLPEKNITSIITPEKSICIIYTSGTTGEPKGIILRHESIISRIKNTNYVNFKPSDRVAQIANIAFDATLFEVWGALLNGAQLHIIHKETVLSEKLFARILNKKEISILFMTASLFHQTLLLIPSAFDGIRQLFFGGEPCEIKTVHKLVTRKNKKRLPLRLTNSYGPTEATIFAVTHSVILNDIQLTTVPIGKPIIGTDLFIANERKKLLPIGVKGELYIGGMGVSSGYINQPELNKEKFLFFPAQKNKLIRVYKTGDVTRWLSDGVLEYIGRKDSDQVKIRGFRIELSEIKKKLCQYKGIHAAIVIAKKEKSGFSSKLIAYLICNERVFISKVREFMTQHLPDYMVPAFFIRINRIPMTANGKIAIDKLPDPDKYNLIPTTQYIPPTNKTQAGLQKIWSQVLQTDIKNISIHTNFFLLGGQSLQAAKISLEVLKQLSSKISIADIFENPTIATLSEKVSLKIRKKLEENLFLYNSSTEKDNIPLSLPQRRIEIIQHLLPNSPAYNVTRSLSVKGHLNIHKFSDSFSQIIERHTILRTAFFTKGGETYQKINSIENLNTIIEIINVENFSDAAIQDCIYKTIQTPFHLEQSPLFKCQIYKKSSQDFLLLFCFHHIIFDGWSLDCFYKELFNFYRSTSKNIPSIKPLEKQYSDFSIWQAELCRKSYFSQAEDYWKQQLSGLNPLNLPTDYERPALQSLRGQHISFAIPTILANKLRALAKKEKTSLFPLFLSSFSVLLHRYSYQEHFTIGVPIANREAHFSKEMIGCFINTLPIRCNFSENLSYPAYLKKIQKTLLEAHKNNEYSLEKIIEGLDIQYNSRFSPLFQVIFSFNEFGKNDLKLKNMVIKPVFINTDTAKSDLGIEIEIRGQKIIGNLEYSTDLFSHERMQQLIEHFLTLLKSITDNPKTSIYTLNILTSEERKKFKKWNKTKANLPWNKSTYQLFIEQAKKTPDNIALQFDENKLTYRELSEKSTALAQYLNPLGVTKGTFTVISMYRSLEMVIALLAVLKNGAVCVPVDPNYPIERINYILSDSHSNIVLTQSRLRNTFIDSELIVINVEEVLHSFDQPLQNTAIKTLPDDIAYVIYTSGSSGKPKGVMCTHKGISNRLLWMQSAYQLTKEDTVLQKTTFCFDVSIWEFFWPLITGARLFIAKPGLHKDPCYILKTVLKENITTIHFVPSMLQAFLAQKDIEQCNGLLKRVISSGEALSISLKDHFFQKLPSVELHNLYGPTEASIDVTAWNCSQSLEHQRVPIGKPIANTQLYVLDKWMNQTPVNLPGELYIGGISVAQGYLNNNHLTETSFVNNPFSKDDSDTNKLYKTGDLVTWLPNGALAFIDRIDNQVKVRGYRIELYEIENTLLQFPPVYQCAVVVKGKEADKQIIAYVVLNAEGTEKTPSTVLRKFLSAKLPEYMIPDFFIIIDIMPLTESGKIDKKSLLSSKDILRDEKQHAFNKPYSPIQISVAIIWKETLKQETLSEPDIDENFFNLGGNSISALNVLSKINEKFSTGITIQALLTNPTIRGVENLIEEYQEQASNRFYDLLRDQKNSGQENSLSIVPIYSAENKPALFLFHPIGGTIFWCLPLAKYLSAHYSIYALQDPAIEAPQLSFKSLEELVGFYVNEIINFQPTAPYLLAGFSSGANLAIEAATQLSDKGKPVQFLGLIDGWALYPQEIYNYDFLKINMMRQFKEMYNKLPENKHYDWGKILSLQWERVKLYETHDLKKINHNISLFKAKNILPIYKSIDDPLNHWKDHTTRTIETYLIPGDHESMLQEPNLKILAEKMLESIQSNSNNHLLTPDLENT